MIIAGPCSIESREQLFETTKELKQAGVNFIRGGCWKPRTRPGGYEGLGEEGLKLSLEMKRNFGVKFCVEVGTPEHLELALKYEMDAIWIGARSTTSPFVMQELADALKGVDILTLIKNPISPDFDLWLGAIERVMNASVKNIMAVHRGFSVFPRSAYRNEPLWEIPRKLKEELPLLDILCDPSHIAGQRDTVGTVMRDAMDTNLFSGFMIESHHMPDIALTDKKQQITPEQLSVLLEKLNLNNLISE